MLNVVYTLCNNQHQRSFSEPPQVRFQMAATEDYPGPDEVTLGTNNNASYIIKRDEEATAQTFTKYSVHDIWYHVLVCIGWVLYVSKNGQADSTRHARWTLPRGAPIQLTVFSTGSSALGCGLVCMAADLCGLRRRTHGSSSFAK